MDIFSEAKKELVTHIKAHALRTDGPFQLASGGTSSWYLDGRQVTYSGRGGRLVAACVGALLDPRVTAIGGMTMGADPVAIATALLAEPPRTAFSIRKQAKEHGAGGRIVGPLTAADAVAVVELSAADRVERRVAGDPHAVAAVAERRANLPLAVERPPVGAVLEIVHPVQTRDVPGADPQRRARRWRCKP